MQLSVLLCTHRPRPEHLRQTLAALRAQTLPLPEWELLVIDNASPEPLRKPPAWHPHTRLLREPRLGLTFARARGIAEARGALLVCCDDDNLLAPDYLARATQLFRAHPQLGAAGGRVQPAYARPLPRWMHPFVDQLAVRDFGPERQVASWKNLPEAERAYPRFAPVGAGMVLRRAVGLEYAARLGAHPVITDRAGTHLSAGGDCDIVLTALRAGWEIAYVPDLALTHLIPVERLRLGHLARLTRAGSESWVRLLARHGLRPWRPISRWTVPLRQVRAFFRHRAWSGRAAYVRWAGACGLFAGRAKIGPPEP